MAAVAESSAPSPPNVRNPAAENAYDCIPHYASTFLTGHPLSSVVSSNFRRGLSPA